MILGQNRPSRSIQWARKSQNARNSTQSFLIPPNMYLWSMYVCRSLQKGAFLEPFAPWHLHLYSSLARAIIPWFRSASLPVIFLIRKINVFRDVILNMFSNDTDIWLYCIFWGKLWSNFCSVEVFNKSFGRFSFYKNHF